MLIWKLTPSKPEGSDDVLITHCSLVSSLCSKTSLPIPASNHNTAVNIWGPFQNHHNQQNNTIQTSSLLYRRQFYLALKTPVPYWDSWNFLGKLTIISNFWRAKVGCISNESGNISVKVNNLWAESFLIFTSVI